MKKKRTSFLTVTAMLFAVLAIVFSGCDNGTTGGGGGSKTYNVTIGSSANGSATASPNSGIKAGATVTLTATPDGGYRLDEFTASPSAGVTFTSTGTNTATFIMPGNDVTITTSFVVYTIGETGPGGGIIFYVAPAGFTVEASPAGTPTANQWTAYTAHCLEAWHTNETNCEWGNVAISTETGISSWGNQSEKDAGLAASIGSGRRDTQIIVSHMNNNSITDTAAQRAITTKGGLSDWFLPSLGELNEFYKLKGQEGIPQADIPQSGFLWSSSQINSSSAWAQAFLDGSHSENHKSNVRTARAIRAF